MAGIILGFLMTCASVGLVSSHAFGIITVRICLKQVLEAVSLAWLLVQITVNIKID